MHVLAGGQCSRNGQEGNKEMTKKTFDGTPHAVNPHVRLVAALAASVASLTLTATTFSEGTLAFYAFDGKTAGESAFGGTVDNKVDASKYRGTVYQAAGAAINDVVDANGGQAYWSSDRPGKYVFARRGFRPEVIATDPGSVEIPYLSNSRGAICAFDSLASELGNLEAWTVEWFWKTPSHYAADSAGGWFQLPLYTTDKTGNAAPGLSVSQTPSSGIRHFRLFATAENAAAGAAIISMQTASLRDGLWHHIAVSYTNHTATLTVDYERAASATMTIAPTNEAVALLLPYSGAFHSIVSCIRVSRGALPSRDFMVSTDCADCYPRAAFHWALDGVPGEEADGVVSNREYVAAAYADFNTNLVGVVANGLGVYGVDTNGNRAVFCDSLPNGQRKNVTWEEQTRLGADGSSLYLKTTPLSLSTMQSDKVVLWTSGTAITSSNSCPPVTGSFTMEMFAKINFKDWRTNTQYVTRKRTTLMGLADRKQSKYYYIWSLEFTPNTSGGSADTFKINAYNSSTASKITNDGKGVSARFSYLGGWHHVAVTYDETDCTMRLYVDYTQVGSALELEAPLLYGTPSGYMYYVGGGLNNHSFDGWVDEVRLVRECLPPEKFIRLSSDPGLKIIFK